MRTRAIFSVCLTVAAVVSLAVATVAVGGTSAAGATEGVSTMTDTDQESVLELQGEAGAIDLRQASQVDEMEDRYEPNDDYESATPISTQPYRDLAISAGDTDVFQTYVESGKKVFTTVRFPRDDYSLEATVWYRDGNGGWSQATPDTRTSGGLAMTVERTKVSGLVYIVVTGRHQDTTGEYDLTVDTQDAITNDAAEPNDEYDQATSISPTETVDDLVLLPGDHDWFTFQADKYDSITVEAETFKSASASDLYIYYQDSNGNWEYVHDNSASTVTDNKVSVDRIPTAGPVYVAAITDDDGEAIEYSLWVDKRGVSNDEYEDNDKYQNAASIDPGTYQNLKLVGEELDWYSMEAERGDTISAATEFDDSQRDLDLTLYYRDENGQYQSLSSESNTDDESVSVDRVPTGGTVYVAVWSQGDTGIGEYTLTTTREKALTNDGREPNDEADTATRIESGNYDDLRIVPGDLDYYQFEASQGESVTASIDFDHDQGDLDMVLYYPDGTGEYRSVMGSSNTDNERVQVDQLPADGTAYVVVWSRNDGAAARYSLELDT